MMNITGGLKVFLAVEPADMRKGYNGLYALATERLKEDPQQGAFLAFTNKPRNLVKLLHFDGTGLWVCSKRLEKGTFAWPTDMNVENGKLKLSNETLALMLNGIDLKGAKIFRFWINDDKDSGDVAQDDSDVPGQIKANCLDGVVNGRCDLLDFFPVWLDLRGILAVLPPGSGVEYRLRSRGLKFVYTTLTSDHAGSYLKEECSSCGMRLNQKAFAARTFPLGNAKLETRIALSATFLKALQVDLNRGVLMVECTSAFSELHLDVVRVATDELIASVRLPLITAPVEEMFDRLSLRGGGSSVTVGNAIQEGAAQNGHVIFVHGFNVSLGESRAAGSEMFKRLWQSKCRCKFHSVTWDGDIGWPDWLDGTHYQQDVDNAFKTAPRMASYVNGLNGTRVVIAHSLGNMVVSSAIADYSMNVNKYFMLNAAIPGEAVDASQRKTTSIANVMLPNAWTDYPSRTWCATWHELFTAPDDRAELKWLSRFYLVMNRTAVYNYYSSGDEVLELFSEAPNNLTGVGIILKTMERYSWHKQEVHKGTGAVEPAGTTWAGWEFGNPVYTLWELVPSSDILVGVNHPYYQDAIAAALAPPSQLRDIPVFKKNPPGMFTNFIAFQLRGEILARGIPALSGPVGSRELKSIAIERNINMNNFKRPNGWPRLVSEDPYQQRWKHGDWKDVAFLYHFTVYEDIATKGGLK